MGVSVTGAWKSRTLATTTIPSMLPHHATVTKGYTGRMQEESVNGSLSASVPRPFLEGSTDYLSQAIGTPLSY